MDQIDKKLSVLIGTCDSYLKYVPNCVHLLNKYFAYDCKKLIVGETDKINFPGYDWCTPGKIQWGSRVKKALSEITTEYTFFMLDDYYLSQKLSVEFINWLLQFMTRENANKITITTVPDWANYRYLETIDTIKRMSPFSEWLSSAQPAIWRTSHLKNVVQENYDPWDFEIIGSEKLKGKENSHFVIKLDEPIYFNFVRKGNVLSPGWKEFLDRENIKL